MLEQTKHGPIAWMTRNSVAANLLMLFLLIGGVLTGFVIKQEIFPEFDVDTIMISVPYPGTSPEEVEQGIIMAVEEAVRDIDGVKEINSVANEGLASIALNLYSGTNGNKALQDVKNAIDAITNLPEDAERPLIRLLMHEVDVISIVIYGEEDEKVLFDLSEKIREELLLKPEVASVKVTGLRSPEISIEIPQRTLRKYGLTLDQVAGVVKMASVDFAGGGVKTSGGEILLRVQERRDYGKEYKDIPVLTAVDGSIVQLGDIASIKEDFADIDLAAYFNGYRAVMVTVASESNQTPIEVAEVIKEYIEELQSQIPETLSITTFNDLSELYADRMNLLMRNGIIGLILVLILLGLFLNLRLAFWVTMGIPISFMGALLFLPFYDVSINMISLFAFIMALGIVVDDAIVVGENVFTLRQKNNPIDASILGTRQMSVPVVFAILTNILAFLPMFFIEGVIGKVFKVVPTVVCLAFIMSLIEALFILPAHLAHSREGQTGARDPLGPVHDKVTKALERFIQRFYRPILEWTLRKRYLTITISAALLIVVIGYVASGRMEFSFGPKAEADIVSVALELPFGSPVEQTEKIQRKLVQAAQNVFDDFGDKDANKGILTIVGTTNLQMDVDSGITEGGHAASITVLLSPADERKFTGTEFSSAWRKKMGEIPGIEKIYFQVLEMGPPAGKPIDIQLSHNNIDILEIAAVELAEELKKFSATRDIDDGFAPGKPQLNFQLKPEAYSLGLTPVEIGRQVRARFYGAEALRLQRGRHEVKVMVRLPERERETELSVEDLMIKSSRGGEIPLREAATVIRDRAYTNIIRADCKRILHVTAEVQPISQKGSILKALKNEVLPLFEKKYPNLHYSLEGEQRETSDSMQSLGKNYIIALIAIFVMLGVIFRSYAQPLIIMLSIPFGIVGAVIGHLIMDFNLSVISMLGITALSGVVLNDALILIDYANKLRLTGSTSYEAIRDAGIRRFRPILLTTLTTFFGLAPMIFETSFQAKILIPMAISLGYGIMFSTFIILVIVPSYYLILEDIRKLFGLNSKEQ